LQTNKLLNPTTAQAIDQRVEKLLKDLGSPPPPLRLDDVRALLKLDIGYYSSDDDSWLREKIHQMRVAGKQILDRPSSILQVVKNLGLKGVLLAEKRRILLDREIPEPKQRWNEAHEITHDLVPWHDGIAHGDPETTLSPGCHELIEAEANYGAGRLLFLGGTLVETVRSSDIDFAAVQSLHKLYGNTMTTTLWRVVEASLDASFGLVSTHPREATSSPEEDIRYFIRSPKFATDFAGVTADAVFGEVQRRCRGRRGPIGDGLFSLTDDRGQAHEFRFQSFFNGHDALTLGKRLVARNVSVMVSGVSR